MLPLPGRRSGAPGGAWILLIALLVAVLAGARALAGYALDYEWWREMGQVPTWLSMLSYGVAPAFAAAVLAFAVLWITHARALKAAGTRLSAHPMYARLSTLALLALAILFALAVVDSWTVVRYFGGRSLPPNATAWHDPVFGHSLSFYLFELPFYSLLLRFVLVLTLMATLLYWIAARGWQLRTRLPGFGLGGNLDLGELRVLGALESRFLRGIVAVFLLALALRFYLDRYDMLLNEHGVMVGVDWVNQNIGLPLQWLAIAGALAAAV